MKLEIGQGARSRVPKTERAKEPRRNPGASRSTLEKELTAQDCEYFDIFLQQRSRETASRWDIFLKLKLFLLVSTAETYKQQHLIQLCHPGTKSVQPIQSYSPQRVEHSNLPSHHPSVSFRFMSSIVYVQLPTHISGRSKEEASTNIL